MMIHIFTKIFCCLRPNTGEMAPLPMAHMLVEPPPRTTTPYVQNRVYDKIGSFRSMGGTLTSPCHLHDHPYRLSPTGAS